MSALGGIPVLAWLFVGSHVVPFGSMEACEAAAQKVAGRCISTITDVSGLEAEIARMQAIIAANDAQWAGRDRAWCGMVSNGVDPGDRRFWPDNRACRKDNPPCPFSPSRPPPCPE